MIIAISSLINLVDLLVRKTLAFFYTFLIKISMLLRGVDFGGGSRFIGKTYFKKGRNNKIIIGTGCTFLSKANSNLIGINRPCIISSIGEQGSVLSIGDNCGFSGTVIGCFSQITIGNNVKCGANTLITDSDWHPEDPRSSVPKPILIEDNVWLGVNVIVLKGVTIGENSVIGAGSVVTKDIPANVIAAGNPCKVIRAINDK